MNKFFVRVVSAIVTLSLFLTSNLPVFAAAQEVYLSDLRLVYADSYQEAQQILADSEFKDYQLLKENLNEGTKRIGTWLAYKTTTDIEEAITDLAVMQMNGGYKEGNYQQMIQDSYQEYVKMGEKYLKAIEYLNQAYDADWFLAQMAYRQLNLYTVKTVGIDQKYAPAFEGELLGEVFYNGIGATELATIFMEGNTHVLNNLRSLLAMGSSYNQDGKTYLEKVGEAVALLGADPNAYTAESGRDFDALAALIAPTITTLKDMFKELCAYEGDLNFEDQEITDAELKYAEHKALANMTRGVNYLNGKTLYDFCLSYTLDKSDYSSLYPLVYALNEGQEAMTQLACYYEVLRYSMSDYPQEYIQSEVAKLEEAYSEKPFNVYEGVDRTVFKGTFALTTNAYRTDAYTERNTLVDAYFGDVGSIILNSIDIAVGGGGIGFMIWGAFERKAENAAALAAKNEIVNKAALTYNDRLADAVNAMASKPIEGTTMFSGFTPDQLMDSLLVRYAPDFKIAENTFMQKFNHFSNLYAEKGQSLFTGQSQQGWLHGRTWHQLESSVGDAQTTFATENTQNIANQVREATTSSGMATSTLLFLVGGAMLLYSALSMGITALEYYYPNYDAVPLSIVDMRETAYGDRYLKYEVVYEAMVKENGSYAAGDLNGFSAQRWNALYYTKSYEAGKPLLADEFSLSGSNNQPKTGYTPVHRFGEVVCYDLNKYSFNDNTSLYLSVKQSKNDKAAVSEVPKVVGSIFANGVWLLFAGAGALVGVGCTLGTQALWKKKKPQANA